MGIVGMIRRSVTRFRDRVNGGRSSSPKSYVCVECRASYDSHTNQCPNCGCWIVVPEGDAAETDARVPW